MLSSPALRDAFSTVAFPPLFVTEFYTDLGQNEALYRRYGSLEPRAADGRHPVEAQLIAHALRDFRLSGVTLTAEPRERFREIVLELAALQARFEQNLMDATDAFQHHELDRGALAGLPNAVLARARALAAERGLDGWLLRLDAPTYQSVLAHAESPALRATFYEAWVTRASDQGPNAGRVDNGAADRRDPRAAPRERAPARLRETPPSYRSRRRWPSRPTRDRVPARSRAARKRVAEQRARRARGVRRPPSSTPWDVAFYSERLRQSGCALAEEELQPYFPLARVIDGLFAIVNRLFGLTITPARPSSVWHPDVRYYEIDGATARWSAASTSISTRGRQARRCVDRQLRLAREPRRAARERPCRISSATSLAGPRRRRRC